MFRGGCLSHMGLYTAACLTEALVINQYWQFSLVALMWVLIMNQILMDGLWWMCPRYGLAQAQIFLSKYLFYFNLDLGYPDHDFRVLVLAF